jgi:hypothetical protein
MDWQPIAPGQLAILDEQGVILRLIVLREPRMGEPDGTKYVVSGKGHDESVHSSLDDAKATAEASLDDTLVWTFDAAGTTAGTRRSTTRRPEGKELTGGGKRAKRGPRPGRGGGTGRGRASQSLGVKIVEPLATAVDR